MIATYYIKTFGCLMNEYDSERIAATLDKMGLSPVIEPNEADIVILNTCSVREKPQHKVNSYVGAVHKVRLRKGKPLLIGVMGCVAQQEGDKLLKGSRQIGFVVGTDSLSDLPQIIADASRGSRRAAVKWQKDSFSIQPFSRSKSQTALVTIMKGCNNFCSYCIVPYVRGVEKSRKPDEILTEVKELVRSGVKEVTLLGQNVNSYGKGKGDNIAEINSTFPQLLSEVAGIDGLLRLRVMTSHPKDFSPDMVAVMKEHSNISSYIHLPLQSGSNKILQLMNRGYTWEEYYDKICYAKEMIPSATFSSDFIVGFPGETEADFLQTVNAVKTVKYSNLYVFNYSVRSGTAAADMVDDVPMAVKTERLTEMNRVQEEIASKVFEQMVGGKVSVLVEGVSKTDSNTYTGRSMSNTIVNFVSDDSTVIGKEIMVTVTESKRNSLFGKY